MKSDWIISIFAIVCITALEIVAIANGLNGAMLSVAVACIAGIAGYTIPKRAKKE